MSLATLALSALFLLTFIASYWVYVEFGGSNLFVAIRNGWLRLDVGFPRISPFAATGWEFGWNFDTLPGRVQTYSISDRSTGRSEVRVAVPLSPALIAIAGISLLFWRRFRRKFAPGYCDSCGYGLAGNTSGRCPECGAVVRCAKCGFDLQHSVGGRCPECGTLGHSSVMR